MVSTQFLGDTAHKLSFWPHFVKSRELVFCYDCVTEIQRKPYERLPKWRVREANFVNKHVPYTISRDGRGEDWEAR